MSQFNLIIVPDEDEAEGALVLVDGTVGPHTYRFLLDTGAGTSSVAYDDYTATFDSAARNHSSGVFASSSADLITVPEIALGPVVKKDFTLVRAAKETQHMPNLIGMDFLKDSCCHFLFDENRVTVDEDYQAGYPFEELWLDKKFHPYVAVECGAVTCKAVWDTGASITIVDLNFIKKYPHFFEEAGQSSGTDATGSQMETPMFVMAEAVIGKQKFPAQRVAGVDLSQVNATLETPMDLILGYSIMRKANWLFDFPRKRWAITKRHVSS